MENCFMIALLTSNVTMVLTPTAVVGYFFQSPLSSSAVGRPHISGSTHGERDAGKSQPGATDPWRIPRNNVMFLEESLQKDEPLQLIFGEVEKRMKRTHVSDMKQYHIISYHIISYHIISINIISHQIISYYHIIVINKIIIIIIIIIIYVSVYGLIYVQSKLRPFFT